MGPHSFKIVLSQNSWHMPILYRDRRIWLNYFHWSFADSLVYEFNFSNNLLKILRTSLTFFKPKVKIKHKQSWEKTLKWWHLFLFAYFYFLIDEIVSLIGKPLSEGQHNCSQVLNAVSRLAANCCVPCIRCLVQWAKLAQCHFEDKVMSPRMPCQQARCDTVLVCWLFL